MALLHGAHMWPYSSHASTTASLRQRGATAALSSRRSGCTRRRCGVGQRRGQEPTALFTGIVQGTAKVTEFKRQPEFATLRAAFPAGSAAGVTIGASVAINGTCLTVTQQHGDELCFDLIVETLRATNLGGLTAGSAVNFERSARVGDEVGGHNVSGHVHTTAVISLIEETPFNRKVVFTVPRALMKYILPKGFIAVDGCSLTVGDVTGDTFNVWLIPETLRTTTFGDKQVGDRVNVELDAQTVAIVNTVERILAAR